MKEKTSILPLFLSLSMFSLIFLTSCNAKVQEEKMEENPLTIIMKKPQMESRNYDLILEASVNSNASIKSITFSSSDTSAIEIVKLNNTSVGLKKLKMFHGYVTIIAKSNDPFVDVQASCKIRCYNPIDTIGDLNYSVFSKQGEKIHGFVSENSNEIIFKTGLHYKCSIEIYTYFGDTSEPYEDGTMVKIEPEAMQIFRVSIQNALGNNTITSFMQNERYDGSGTTNVYFEFDCNEVIEGKKMVEVDNETALWDFYSYQEVTHLESDSLNQNYVI